MSTLPEVLAFFSSSGNGHFPPPQKISAQHHWSCLTQIYKAYLNSVLYLWSAQIIIDWIEMMNFALFPPFFKVKRRTLEQMEYRGLCLPLVQVERCHLVFRWEWALRLPGRIGEGRKLEDDELSLMNSILNLYCSSQSSRNYFCTSLYGNIAISVQKLACVGRA